MSTTDVFSVSITRAIADHPYAFVAALTIAICVLTRIRTGLQVNYKKFVAEGTPRQVPVIPYWIPIIGHTISYGTRFQQFIQGIAYSIPSGIFALKVGGGTHNIVVSPSLTKELFNRPSIPITIDPLVWRFLEYTFGDRGGFRAWNDQKPDDLVAIGKILHNLMREPFLSNAIADTVREAEQRTWNLISGNPSWVDHSTWERAGRVEILPQTSNHNDFIAEADLFALIRYFIGDIASTILMGHAFVENNPTMLSDLWLFDTKVQTLMLGLPNFLLPGVLPAIGARERLIEAVREHHKAMIDVLDGKDPGYRYNDLNDVSSLMWDRLKAFKLANASPRLYACGDLTVLWAMNVNANQVIFWLLFFIYRDPTLLSTIRSEIAPYVQFLQPDSKGLPIKPAPRLKIDIDALVTKCPWLKGAFLETMRLEVAATSFRVATDDFTVTETKEDAAFFGKPHPDKYVIKKDEFVVIPHIVHHENPRYFENPNKFDARRFWVKKKHSGSDDAEKEEKNDGEEEQISVEYGTMRPWGGGKTMCKGRNFAEREVLALAAAILVIWDVEPAGKHGWEHPGNVVTAGTFIPKRDVRVRMRRRKLS